MHQSIALDECFHLVLYIFLIFDAIYIYDIIVIIRVKYNKLLSYLLYLTNMIHSECIFTREKDKIQKKLRRSDEERSLIQS